MNTLNQLYQSDSVIQAIVDYYNSISRAEKEVKVGYLLRQLNKSVCRFQKQDVTAALKKLQSSQFGTYVVGKRGHVSRFKWASPPRQICQTVNPGQHIAATAITNIGNPSTIHTSTGSPLGTPNMPPPVMFSNAATSPMATLTGTESLATTTEVAATSIDQMVDPAESPRTTSEDVHLWDKYIRFRMVQVGLDPDDVSRFPINCLAY
jgi:hypothetical protein